MTKLSTMKTTKPVFPSRHILSSFFVLLLCGVLLHNVDYGFDEIIKFRESPDSPSNADSTSSKRAIPPPLREVIDYDKGSPAGDELAKRAWTQPRVLKSYVRRMESDDSQDEVFLFVTGVLLGMDGRNLSIVGCMIGDEVYGVVNKRTRLEVFVCHVPRRVEIGEFVSLVIKKDGELSKAMGGERLRGMDMKIGDGDIVALPGTSSVFMSDVDRKSLVMIRSDSRIEHIAPKVEELQHRARYKVCMGTEMKTATHLAKDWVEYHRKLGVDMVYILDNGAVDNVTKLVSKHTGVEVVYWPFLKSQTQAMSYLLHSVRERCVWILLCDVDEYVLLGLDDNDDPGDIRDYVNNISEDTSQEILPYLTMGPSGHLKRPKTAPAEAYTYKHVAQKRNGKSIGRSDAAWVGSSIHRNIGDGRKVVVSEMENERPSFGDQAILVHFQMRCLEDMIEKRDGGSGSVLNRLYGARNSGWPSDGSGPAFRKGDEALRYTYFRDVWRRVVAGKEKQMVVRDGIETWNE